LDGFSIFFAADAGGRESGQQFWQAQKGISAMVFASKPFSSGRGAEMVFPTKYLI
jgi:hypothetical protein